MQLILHGAPVKWDYHHVLAGIILSRVLLAYGSIPAWQKTRLLQGRRPLVSFVVTPLRACDSCCRAIGLLALVYKPVRSGKNPHHR